METNSSEKSPMPKPPLLEHCLSILRGLEANLHSRGVLSAAVFGSVARGEDDDNSEIGLVVTIQDGIGFGMSGLLGLEDELTEVFGRKVEVVDIGGLHYNPYPANERVLREMVRAF